MGYRVQVDTAGRRRRAKTILHNFGRGQDGGESSTGLSWDGAGNLYGTAPYGGKKGADILFEITP